MDFCIIIVWMYLNAQVIFRIDNFDQEEAIKLLENVKNEADSSLTDSDAQIIADMTEQIELFDFISAAETLKKWRGDVQ